MLRATKSSVDGTLSRKASSTALRPATISPRGLSPRGARAGLISLPSLRPVVTLPAPLVVVLLELFFATAFLRFAAA
ncbi:unannotated protein [freshwater metagenome]|uniref:Unannotated protein n=1 Tax=freshwater metagenome TaxID=449393 RepID=A0A6J7B6K2_9ZZZZ